MNQCSVPTKDKKGRPRPCRVPADRFRAGAWFCHIHDPRGKFQANKQEMVTRSKPNGEARKPVGHFVGDDCKPDGHATDLLRDGELRF